MTQNVPNPFITGTEISLSRLQELASREPGLIFHSSSDSVTLRFEDSRSSLPDLKMLIYVRDEEKYVELLSSVQSCYNPSWVPDRKMNSKLKWFIAKLVR